MSRRRSTFILATILVALALTLGTATVVAGKGGKPPGGGGGGPTSLIAFSGDAAVGTNQIYTVKPNGRSRSQLTSDGSRQHRGPRWAPDGRFIALYTKDQPGQQDSTHLVVIDPDGNTQTDHPVPYVRFVRWTNYEARAAEDQLIITAEESGGGVFGTEHTNLIARDISGTNPVALTSYAPDLSDPNAKVLRGAVGAAWLRDGPDPNTTRLWYLFEEVVLDANNQVVGTPVREHHVIVLNTSNWPTVSVVSDVLAPDMPADNTVAWSRLNTSGLPYKVAWGGGSSGISVAPVTFDAGGLPAVDLGQTVFVADTGKFPRSPSFSPDGSEIAFVDWLRSNAFFDHIYVTDATQNSSAKKVDGLANSQQASGPHWGP